MNATIANNRRVTRDGQGRKQSVRLRILGRLHTFPDPVIAFKEDTERRCRDTKWSSRQRLDEFCAREGVVTVAHYVSFRGHQIFNWQLPSHHW